MRKVKATFEGEYLKVTFTGMYIPDPQGQDYTDNVEVDSISIMDINLPRENWPQALADNLMGLSWDLYFEG